MSSCPTPIFVFTDVATDDLQAIYYLASRSPHIAGIIIDTCVPDADNAIRNITLFNYLFFDNKLKIYRGSLRAIPNIPIEWRLDAQYTRYYLEQLYYEKTGKADYCVPCYPCWHEIQATRAILVTQTRVSTAVKFLSSSRFKVEHVYSMLGKAPNDPVGEINAETDLKAYHKLLSYPQVSDFTLADITSERIEKARLYCEANPPLIDIIRPVSRPDWPFWDLTMVMNFF